MNNSIRKKAFGIIKSIEVMNDNERKQRPSESFGKNYNKLREICLENNPKIEKLIPPIVEFENYGYDEYPKIFTKHNYSEIHTFCSEIYHLLE